MESKGCCGPADRESECECVCVGGGGAVEHGEVEKR